MISQEVERLKDQWNAKIEIIFSFQKHCIIFFHKSAILYETLLNDEQIGMCLFS